MIKENKERNGIGLLIIISIISIAIRLYKIGSTNYVTWDESHFGKFANYYLKRSYYTDLHPPIGKMLIAALGWVSGYRGDFSFESAKKYDDQINYKFIRAACAILGGISVSFVYLACLCSGLSKTASLLASLLVMFDNGQILFTRLILLDPFLVFFSTGAIFFYWAFRNQKRYGLKWHGFLLLTGIMLGFVSSIKWVGLLTVASIGYGTIDELWRLWKPSNRYGRKKLKGVKEVSYNFIIRVITLIIFPTIIYIIGFWIHFKILNKTGPGDQDMTPAFQASLIGNPIKDDPNIILNRNEIVIKCMKGDNGYLHSHSNFYPESQRQQVTTYGHPDENNYFIIENLNNDMNIKVGEKIKLIHKETGKYIATDNNYAKISNTEREVYGTDESKNEWEIVGKRNGERLTHLSSIFQLKNLFYGCYLTATGNRYPDWGFNQGEVVCRDLKENSSFWVIERNINPKQSSISTQSFKKKSESFLNTLLYINRKMWQDNRSLIQDPELEKDQLITSPWDWFLIKRGTRITPYDEGFIRLYALGNPITWGFAAISVAISLLLLIRSLLYSMGRKKDKLLYGRKKSILIFYFFSWMIHFLPFLLIGRVLYIHHYLLAVIYGCICGCILMDLLPKIYKFWAFGLTITFTIYNFWKYSPICYGMYGPIISYDSLRWRYYWAI